MDDFVVLSSKDCIPMPTGDQNSSGIFGQLYNDLLAQLKVKKTEYSYFLHITKFVVIR